MRTPTEQAERVTPVITTKPASPVIEVAPTLEEARLNRILYVLRQKQVVTDSNWAKPQENLDAWQAGSV